MGNLRRKESCKSNDEEEEEDEETEDAEEEGDGPNPDSYFPISKSRSISRRARSRSRRGSGSQRRTCLKKFKHFTLNCSDGEATPKDLDKNTSNPVVTHTPAPTVVSPKVVVSEGEEPNVSLYDDEPAPGFIHCDLLAMIIVMLYGLALLALILDIRSYQHDSNWNGVVRSIYPFPDIPEETFFSGKFLIIYEADPGLFHAKKHLLREDRWLEVDHIIFLVVFLITTILQFTAYITRGSENQMKSTIFYFAFVGACGIVISFFPILSWNAMLVGYSFAIDHLNEFISRQIRSPGDLPTITNVTILDAINIARIMEHCREFVKPGVSSNSDPQTYTMLNRQYTSDELQKLGFCTHYEYKVASSVVTFIFSLLCGVIPCLYCGERKQKVTQEVDPLDMFQEDQNSSPPPTMEYRSERIPRKHRCRHRNSSESGQSSNSGRRRDHSRSKKTSRHERHEIERWKYFISQGEDE